MKRAVFLAVLLGATGMDVALADDVLITSFTGNGILTWTNAMPDADYRIEWAPSISGTWMSSWTNLTGIRSTGPACAAAVPMFYRVVAQQPRTYSAKDYWPTDPNTYGQHVFEETRYVPEIQHAWTTNEITGFMKVPYFADGIIIGVVVGAADGTSGTSYYNDGHTVRIIGGVGAFFVSDTGWNHCPFSLGEIYDGMAVTNTFCIVSAADGALLQPSTSIPELWQVRTVTVPTGSYADCLLQWRLAPGHPYVNLDAHGLDAEMGITIPTAMQTGGAAILSLACYARDVGAIAQWNCDHLSGQVTDSRRLQTMLGPSPWIPTSP
jgi:hypothetical protein